MCDTRNHTTGWKVVALNNITEDRWGERSRAYLGAFNVCWLYLRCRTDKCIDTQMKKIDGHWKISDFS